ncbi:hypothetical protein [Pseudomonas sp. ANT_H4]|uniref:hypothetical protein n=1 Tax=Pseudomonas sp. ANT_H4 TaxID=2597350 RepID=UPI0015B4F99B|nr:hypothetical protein [Pseudomonas sp. ANT_H4]
MGRQIQSLIKSRAKASAGVDPLLCRSELAREEPEGTAFIQEAHVIVNDHRRNAARSKLAPTVGSGQWAWDLLLLFTTQVGYQAAVLLLLI